LHLSGEMSTDGIIIGQSQCGLMVRRDETHDPRARRARHVYSRF